ncbi:hypothetical protein MJO10_33690, partial [Salmonella enterica subsp. enterica serovar Anatum]|nr:hypothetical protein [Salmonella enterica subsp. enterica serovar Anatum]
KLARSIYVMARMTVSGDSIIKKKNNSLIEIAAKKFESRDRELRTLTGSGSKWVLPARKMQHRMIPHIQESTLPVALAKVRRE